MNPPEYFTRHRVAVLTVPPRGPRSLRPFPHKRGSPILVLLTSASYGCSRPASIDLQTRYPASPPTNLDTASRFKTYPKSPSRLCAS